MTHSMDKNNLPRSSHWGGLATVLWGTAVALFYIFVQIFVVGLYVSLKTTSRPDVDVQRLALELSNTGFVLSISTFSATLFCVPLIFFIIMLKRGSSLKDYLALDIPSIKNIFPWFGVFLILLILYDLITHMIGRSLVPEFMITAYKTAGFQPLFWTALIVLAPLSEEIFFRGFLFKGFQSTFLRSVGTILLTALLWAVIHTQYDIYDITFVFIIGILLGAARVKTGSILPPIFLHGFMNLVALIETAVAVS